MQDSLKGHDVTWWSELNWTVLRHINEFSANALLNFSQFYLRYLPHSLIFLRGESESLCSQCSAHLTLT